MYIEPSILEILDFIKVGVHPTTADRCVCPFGKRDVRRYFTDFIADSELLKSEIKNCSSEFQRFSPMSELASSFKADYDASKDASVRLSCLLLKATGSINFSISMVVNDFLVTYELYYDFPCSK